MSNETTQKIVKANADIERSVKQITDYQTLFSKDIATTKTQFLKTLTDVQKDFSQSFNSLIQEYENLISPLSQKKNQAVTRDIESLNSKLNLILSQTRSVVQGASKDFENQIVSMVQQSVGILGNSANKVSQQVDSIYKAENEAVLLIRDNLNSSVDRLKDEYSNKVEQEIEMVKSSTKDMMDDVIRRLEQFRSETGNIADGGEENIKAVFRTVISDITSGFESSAASLRDVLATLEEKLTTTFDEKNAAYQDMADNFTKRLHEQTDQHVISIDQGAEDVVTALNGYKGQEKEHLTNILSQIKTSFVQSANLVDTKTQKEYQAILNFFRNKLYTSIEQVSNGFQESYNETLNLFDTLITQLNNSKTVLEKSHERLVNKPISAMSAIGEEIETSLHQMVEFLNAQYNHEKSKIQQELDKRVESYSSDHVKRLSALEGILLQSIQKVAADQKATLNAQKEDVQQFSNSQIEEIKQVFQNVQETTTHELQSKLTDQRKWLENTNLDINRRIQDDSYKYVQVLSGISPQILTIADSFQENRQESFERAISALDSASHAFKTEVSDWAAGIYSLVEQQMSTVINRLESRQTESKLALDSALADIKDNQEQMVTEIKGNTAEKFNAIDNKIAEHEASIVPSVEQVILEFHQNMDKFIEQKQRQASQLGQKNNDFTTKSTNLIEETKDSFESFEPNISVQIENIVRPAQKILTASHDLLIDDKRPTN